MLGIAAAPGDDEQERRDIATPGLAVGTAVGAMRIPEGV
jgi:hypothetical protein